MTTRAAHLFFGPVVTGSSNLYTVAAGLRVVLKQILLQRNSGTGTQIGIIALTPTGGGSFVSVVAGALANGGQVAWAGYHVLHAGDSIDAFSGAAGTEFAAIISGAVLPAP